MLSFIFPLQLLCNLLHNPAPPQRTHSVRDAILDAEGVGVGRAAACRGLAGLEEVDELCMRWCNSIKGVDLVCGAMMSCEFETMSVFNWLLSELPLERIQSIPYLRNYHGARDVDSS